MNNQILPFRLKITKEKITDRGGLAFFSEFMESIGLKEKIEKEFPLPGSNRGIKAYKYIRTLIFHFLDGGRFLEDIRDIANDEAFKELVCIKRFPSPDAVGLWLRRQGKGGMERYYERLIREQVRRYIDNFPDDELTCDIDSTVIRSEKGDGDRSYNGEVGYNPILVFLSDGTDRPICSYAKFRKGSASPRSDILTGLKKTEAVVSSMGKRIRYFRSDSAGYQSEIINYCHSHSIYYTITAVFDSSVKEEIGRIRNQSWKRFRDRYGHDTEYEYTEIVHTLNRSNHSFRMIIKRRRSYQLNLFGEIDYSSYYAVITNIPEEEMSGEEVLHHHQGRGNCERFIEDVKYGVNLRYVPCGTIEANSIYFMIGMIAFNLVKLFQILILGGSWVRRVVTTIRRKFLRMVGRVSKKSRYLWFGINCSKDKIEELKLIRIRIYALSFS